MKKTTQFINKEFVLCAKVICTDDKKVRYPCHFIDKYRGAGHSVCNPNYKIPKEIPIVFHNGCTYYYQCIIKEIAEEFKRQFECLEEITEKYITFFVSIENNEKDQYKTKFIDSFRFMPGSLSSLVDNFFDELYIDKYIDCKYYLDYILIRVIN